MATPLARYDLSPIRTFTYGTEEVYARVAAETEHPAQGLPKEGIERESNREQKGRGGNRVYLGCTFFNAVAPPEGWL